MRSARRSRAAIDDALGRPNAVTELPITPQRLKRLMRSVTGARDFTGETRMDLELQGKTALVTGGSEGIGKGIALALAKEGVDVAMCARRKEPLKATAARSPAPPIARSSPIPADLRKDADAKNFIEQGHAALGRIDILVNNAGSAAGGVIEHLTEDDWERAFSSNSWAMSAACATRCRSW